MSSPIITLNFQRGLRVIQLVTSQGWIQGSSSDFQKSLKCFQACVCFFLRFFIVVQEINYPSCFTVYYEIKQRKELFRPLHSEPNSSRANSTSLRSCAFVLCRYRRETREKIRWHDRRKSVRSGWDWVVYGSFHKSLKTLFDWSETLTLSCELLKLGCDWLSRSQTTVETTDNRI